MSPGLPIGKYLVDKVAAHAHIRSARVKLVGNVPAHHNADIGVLTDQFRPLHCTVVVPDHVGGVAFVHRGIV